MIEINLLPGSVKKSKRKAGMALSAGPLANLKLPPMDRIMGAAIGMWVVGIALIIWMQTSSSSQLKEVTLQKEALERDTANLGKQLAQNRLLRGKQDTIAEKLKVIQELDAGRYDWAHILDEVSRAVPDYTWLVAISPSDADDPQRPAFKIEGRMANAFALPKFMTELENSPFVSNVTLRSSGPVVENQRPIYQFVVEGQYEAPPADVIRTEPLFGPDLQPDSAISAAVSASAPAPAGATPGAAPAPGRATPPANGRATPPANGRATPPAGRSTPPQQAQKKAGGK